MKTLPILSNDRELVACVDRLRVLADPTRLSVIRLLLAGPRPVQDISTELSVERSLLSHHLRLLREAKLVKGVRKGKQIRYEVAEGVEKSFVDESAIDLGCCRLTFAEAARASPRRSRRS